MANRAALCSKFVSPRESLGNQEALLPDVPASTIASMNDELSAAGEGLAGNDEILRGVLAGCGDCIKILDLDGRLQFMSEGGKRVMEVDDFGELKGRPWPDVWAGVGNAEATLAVDKARSGVIARFQGVANTAKGNPRHWDVQVAPIFGVDGKPSYILAISRDITPEKRAEAELAEAYQRQKLLTAELQHRIKNTLAMVSAIANQTMRGNDVEAARKAFTARMLTLAHAHDILVKTSWTSAPIKQVIEGALAPHRTGQDRFEVSGPELLLQPKPALAIALAVHELATNAMKYGALSKDGGRVRVRWATNIRDGIPGFDFDWNETGGPPVVTPEPSQTGFGTRLIERMLKNDVGGDVRLNFAPDGVSCEVRAPLGNLVESEPLEA
jgi:PAS domain S-box-containing protein